MFRQTTVFSLPSVQFLAKAYVGPTVTADCKVLYYTCVYV